MITNFFTKQSLSEVVSAGEIRAPTLDSRKRSANGEAIAPLPKRPAGSSSDLSSGSSSKSFTSSSTSTKILSWNINSICTKSGPWANQNKVTELLKIVYPKPDVIVLQEVKIKASDNMPQIPGYKMSSSALCSVKREKGCMIYTAVSLQYEVSSIDDFDTVDEKSMGRQVGVRLATSPPTAIIGVYSVNALGKTANRDKELERKAQDEALDKQVKYEFEAGHRIVVAGDFNVTMSLLDKGLTKSSNLWGRQKYEDIPSAISRIEDLCSSYGLIDTWRETHKNQQVSNEARTTTWTCNSSFGKAGAKLDYIFASSSAKSTLNNIKRVVDLCDDSDNEENEGDEGNEGDANPSTSSTKQFSNAEIFYGKGFYGLVKDFKGNGSDHLPLILELEN